MICTGVDSGWRKVSSPRHHRSDTPKGLYIPPKHMLGFCGVEFVEFVVFVSAIAREDAHSVIAGGVF
jgi:hypothetical protein